MTDLTVHLDSKGDGKDIQTISAPSIEPGERTPIREDGYIEIDKATAATSLNPLKISVSKDPYLVSGTEEVTVTPLFNVATGYKVRLKDVEAVRGKKIQHGDFVIVSATTVSGEAFRGYLRVVKPVSWSGIATPAILYRVNGNSADFTARNLAPSIATGFNFNTDNYPITYYGLDLVATSYPDTNSHYSLALGPLVDIGGFGQVGASYSFKEKGWSLIVAARPEIVFRLIPSLAPSP